MAKPAVQHACTECGYSAGRWFGKCPGCGAFGTLVEEAPPDRKASASAKPLLRLVDVEADEAERIATGVPELDRVLGGGLVPASLVLVGGEPGVGKSTLLLTALAAISKDRRALLVTGEESSAQVKLRAARLGGADRVEILAETDLENVLSTLETERPDVCVIDSVQTLYSRDVGSAPGSVGQVREAAARLLRIAKEAGVATILVRHGTKDGTGAGPRLVEHLVDRVLQVEGDRYHAHRVLRAVKNRFGCARRPGEGRPCRVRGDRAHRAAATGGTGGAPARGMRQARPGCRGRSRGDAVLTGEAPSGRGGHARQGARRRPPYGGRRATR